MTQCNLVLTNDITNPLLPEEVMFIDSELFYPPSGPRIELSLTLARQAFHHLNHDPVPFTFSFLDKILPKLAFVILLPLPPE
jgi:hypothetical protein